MIHTLLVLGSLQLYFDRRE